VMCAGVTMYEPLKFHGIKAGMKVGIAGLGGLGVMGIKLAAAMGCEVTAMSRSQAKASLAKECGATHYIASSDEQAMTKSNGTLDIILDTIPTAHDWKPYYNLFNSRGKLIFLGINTASGAAMLACKSSIMLSSIGSIKNTQEVIDLCAKSKIYPNLKLVPVTKIAEVFEALDGSNDSGERFVLDIAGSLNEDLVASSWHSGPPKLQPASAHGIGYCGIVKEFIRMRFCTC